MSFERKPSHRCKVCGALWLMIEAGPLAGMWTLVSPIVDMGKCCDNQPMREQIERIEEPSRAR